MREFNLFLAAPRCAAPRCAAYLRRIILIFFITGSAVAAQAPAAAQSGSASAMAAAINNARAASGLYAYSTNPILTAVAQQHADWMAANRTYSHTGAGGSTPQSRANAAGYAGWVGENMVGGTLMTVQGGIEWWRNSPVHNANLMSTRYTEMGVGYAYGPDEQHRWVLVLGQPGGAASSGSAGGGGSSSGGNTSGADDGPFFVVEPVVRAEPRDDGAVWHVVGQGQTLWDIAAVYDQDIDNIRRLNNFPETPLLIPGDEVLVSLPGGVTPTPVPTPTPDVQPDGSVLYEVQPGDTAWRISRLFNLDLLELMQYNQFPIDSDPVLLPGMQVIISPPTRPTSAPDEPVYHTVQTGDTAWSIAAAHSVPLEDLLALNGLGADPVLQPGDELLVALPPPTRTPTVTPSPTLPPAVTELAQAESPTPAETATPSPTLPPTVTVLPPTATTKPTATIPPSPAPPPGLFGGALGEGVVPVALFVGIGLAVLAGGVILAGLLLDRRG